MTGRQNGSSFTRRHFLARSAAIGCSLAASPLLTPVVLAAAPWERRLVVIILRGGMDGLDAVRPLGAPGYVRLRPTLAAGATADSHDLDGYFAAHRALGPLMELWQREELGFVHAVATPYRDKRSHFDGQDLLEAGTATLDGRRDGWLNRALQLLPGTESRTAWAIGHGEMKVLEGPAPVADWAPDAGVALSPQAELLAGLVMAEDPLFRAALSEALALSRADAAHGADRGEDGGESMAMSGTGGGRKAHLEVARFVGRTLRDEGRIAAFSLNGWDSHRRQPAVIGAALGRLADTILTLRDTMGPAAWARTAILAMSEFGRTVAENGTGGTDHGTGGVLVLAGGAIRGGRVLGRWPGLGEADLYDRRDLMPTSDLRAHAAWVLRGVTGLDRAALEGTVFPGLDMGTDPGLLR